MVAGEAYAVMHDIWFEWDHDSAKQRDATRLRAILAKLRLAQKRLGDPERWTAAGMLREIAEQVRQMGRDELSECHRYVEGAYSEIMNDDEIQVSSPRSHPRQADN
jgi:hypothetical protein